MYIDFPIRKVLIQFFYCLWKTGCINAKIFTRSILYMVVTIAAGNGLTDHNPAISNTAQPLVWLLIIDIFISSMAE